MSKIFTRIPGLVALSAAMVAAPAAIAQNTVNGQRVASITPTGKVVSGESQTPSLFSIGSKAKPRVVAAPGSRADAYEIVYTEQVLLEEDFSSIGGTEAEPIDIVNEDCTLQGLEGWKGLSLSGVGGAIRINAIENYDAQLVPPFAEMGVYKTAFVYLSGKIAEPGEIAISSYNGEDKASGTVMVGSTQAPTGWVYGGCSFADGDDDFLNTEEFKMTKTQITLPDEAMLLEQIIDSWDFVSLGTFPIDRFSARIQSWLGSDVIIDYYKVVALTPSLDTPTGVYSSDYGDGNFKLNWEPVEGAEKYVVELYDATYGWGWEISLNTTMESDTNSAIVNCDTSRPVFVDVYAVKDNERSQATDPLFVYGVGEPEFTSIKVPEDGTLELAWDVDPRADYLNLFIQAGNKNEAAVNGFEVASLPFAEQENTNPDDAQYTEYFDHIEAGWIGYPAVYFEDGALVGSNLSGSWGMADFVTLEGQGAYDFSNVEEVTVKVTVKATTGTSMNVEMLTYNEIAKGMATVATVNNDIASTEYKTYEVKLPGGMKNAFLRIATFGDGMVWFEDVKVSCDLPAGTTFCKPVIVGQLPVSAPQEDVVLEVPAGYDTYKVTGQAVRAAYNDPDSPDRQVVYYSQSAFSEPLSTSDPNGIGSIATDNTSNSAIYYNLQGVRVSPSESGVYIRVNGTKADKVFVK